MVSVLRPSFETPPRNPGLFGPKFRQLHIFGDHLGFFKREGHRIIVKSQSDSKSNLQIFAASEEFAASFASKVFCKKNREPWGAKCRAMSFALAALMGCLAC